MKISRRLLLTAAILSAALPALAGGRERSSNGPASGTVVAESRFGHGTVTGPVRMTSLGRQVRLPGGTWEYCKRSCSETLRASTVDFWEAQNPTGTGAECGIFGCLTLRYPR